MVAEAPNSTDAGAAAGGGPGAAVAAAKVTQAATPAQPKPSVVPEDASRLSTQAIHVIAQGIPNLPQLREDAAAALAPDAEYRIREIVQDSIKFMRHAKRCRLTTGDVNAALRLRNVEPLYGFGHSHSGSVAPASAVGAGADGAVGGAGGIALNGGVGAASVVDGSVAAAADVAGSAVGAGDGSVALGSGKLASSQFNRVDGVDDLFFVEDAEVNLKKLIEGPLPAVPLDYTVNPHWLAVNGVQPAIPQNPSPESSVGKANGGGSGTQPSTVAEKLAAVAADPVVKPRVKHFLGKELQLYYEHVTLALAGDNPVQRDACLVSLSEDPGLNQLLPYFTLHIRDTVHKSLKNLPLLFSLMRLARALLTNPHFEVEHYLHQLLPPVLTCLVGKRLCTKSKEDHWQLRVLAAELVGDICKRYGPSYHTVQPRITKTLKDAFVDKGRSLTTHYGAVLGLGVLGVRVVDLLLIPNLKAYSPSLLAVLDQTASKPKSVRRLEAAKMFGALAWAVAISAKQKGMPTLEENGHFVSEIPPQKIDVYLPEFSTRFPALVDTYGDRLYPALVSTKASDISNSIFAASAANAVAPGKDPDAKEKK